MNSKAYFVIYEAINCNPNGDPANENAPRMNGDRAVVSDLRLKRDVRLGFKNLGYDIFVDFNDDMKTDFNKEIIETSETTDETNETTINKPTDNSKKPSGASVRFFYHLKNKYYKDNKNVKKLSDITDKSNNDMILIMLNDFLDARLFGGMLTSSKYNINITGCFQPDAETLSLNDVTTGIENENNISREIISTFPTNKNKKSGGRGDDNFIRYAVFSHRLDFNANIAEINNVVENDLKLFIKSIWLQLSNFRTRSKNRQPIAIIEIDLLKMTFEQTSKNAFKTLDKFFKPCSLIPSIEKDKNWSSKNIRTSADYLFDFSNLFNLKNLNSIVNNNVDVYNNDVAQIKVYSTPEFINKYFKDNKDIISIDIYKYIFE